MYGISRLNMNTLRTNNRGFLVTQDGKELDDYFRELVHFLMYVHDRHNTKAYAEIVDGQKSTYLITSAIRWLNQPFYWSHVGESETIDGAKSKIKKMDRGY